jgi:hypothetical protein
VPITINWPPTNGPIGPGYTISVTSDFVGPIPVDAWWTVAVLEPGEETHTVVFQRFPIGSSDHELQCVVGDLTVPFQDLLTQHQQIPQDTSLTLLVTLDDESGTIDEGSDTVKWDGTGRLFAQVATQSTLTPGLTAPQEAKIDAIQESMAVDFQQLTGVGGNVVRTLGQLVDSPPDTLLCAQSPVDISGIGTLNHPFLTFTVGAYGGYIELLDVPPELGITPGVAIEWTERLGQFVVIRHPTSGNEYRDPIVDFHTDHTRIRFSPFNTSRIEYALMPGVVVRWWWLQLCA